MYVYVYVQLALYCIFQYCSHQCGARDPRAPKCTSPAPCGGWSLCLSGQQCEVDGCCQKLCQRILLPYSRRRAGELAFSALAATVGGHRQETTSTLVGGQHQLAMAWTLTRGDLFESKEDTSSCRDQLEATSTPVASCRDLQQEGVSWNPLVGRHQQQTRKLKPDTLRPPVSRRLEDTSRRPTGDQQDYRRRI